MNNNSNQEIKKSAPVKTVPPKTAPKKAVNEKKEKTPEDYQKEREACFSTYDDITVELAVNGFQFGLIDNEGHVELEDKAIPYTPKVPTERNQGMFKYKGRYECRIVIKNPNGVVVYNTPFGHTSTVVYFDREEGQNEIAIKNKLKENCQYVIFTVFNRWGLKFVEAIKRKEQERKRKLELEENNNNNKNGRTGATGSQQKKSKVSFDQVENIEEFDEDKKSVEDLDQINENF